VKQKYENRWSEGIPHHPASEWLVEKIAEVDFQFYGDYFCWKVGGDGDNGESLMYIIDDILDDEELRREFMEKI
jgi:hypothetical protein